MAESHYLNSVTTLQEQTDRAEDEREQICKFIRYVQRKAENMKGEEAAAELLRGLREDIEAAKHYESCYQQ